MTSRSFSMRSMRQSAQVTSTGLDGGISAEGTANAVDNHHTPQTPTKLGWADSTAIEIDDPSRRKEQNSSSLSGGSAVPTTPVMHLDSAEEAPGNEDCEEDSDNDDIFMDNEMDAVRDTVGLVGSELIGMIRDYLEAERLTKTAADSMLFEVNSIMGLLEKRGTRVIPENMVNGVVVVAWHWISRCENDDVVVLTAKHKRQLLRKVWEFATATVISPE